MAGATIKLISDHRLVSFVISVIMVVLATILPFAYRIDIGPGPDSIRAMFWDYIESEWFSGFRLWNPLDALPYTFLRFVFAVYFVRFCLGTTTARKTILAGILAELQPIIVSAPQIYFIDWTGDPLVPLYIPIPIMLTLGIILVLFLKLRFQHD
jgi:hypothetical protein